jgi:hypothetical protein
LDDIRDSLQLVGLYEGGVREVPGQLAFKLLDGISGAKTHLEPAGG